MNEQCESQWCISGLVKTQVSVYLSFKVRGNQAKVLGVLYKPGKMEQCYLKSNVTTISAAEVRTDRTQDDRVDASVLEGLAALLLLKDLLFMFRPNIHELPRFVHLHGVVHQTIHVDKLDSPLFRVVHHWWDDGKLSHLFFVVLWNRGGDAVRPQPNSGFAVLWTGVPFVYSSILKDTTSSGRNGGLISPLMLTSCSERPSMISEISCSLLAIVADSPVPLCPTLPQK